MFESALANTLLASVALGTACALLSVVVVLRRWAFIGEGIAHAGFGGVGTAWILALLVPAFEKGGQTPLYLTSVAFCLAMAAGIAALSRRERVHADTAIGVFLVASMAWGFVAYGIYGKVRGAMPPGWEAYIIGQMGPMNAAHAMVAVTVCLAVIATLAALARHIVAYCFDPMLAETSGVPGAFIHFLLILLVAMTIVVGIRLTGPLLVTALLILPGATGLLLSRRLARVAAIAVAVGVVGAVSGPLLSHRWRFIPEGPAIVLTLVLQFALAYTASAAARFAQRRLVAAGQEE